MQIPYIIGITGGSGSGKTSLINQLKKEFSTEALCVISQDDYYRPREEQKIDNKGIKNFDLPTSIDSTAFYADILKLRQGQKVQRKEYTFNNDLKQASTIAFYPAPVIVVEGLFVFHFAEISDIIDLKVFIHAKENLKVIRRIKRDKKERNYPLDDVLYRYQYHVTPTFEKYILPYMEEADIVINNNTHFDNALELLKAFIKSKSQEK